MTTEGKSDPCGLCGVERAEHNKSGRHGLHDFRSTQPKPETCALCGNTREWHRNPGSSGVHKFTESPATTRPDSMLAAVLAARETNRLAIANQEAEALLRERDQRITELEAEVRDAKAEMLQWRAKAGEATKEVERLRHESLRGRQFDDVQQDRIAELEAELDLATKGLDEQTRIRVGLEQEVERLRKLSDVARLDVMWQELVRQKDIAETALAKARETLKLWRAADSPADCQACAILDANLEEGRADAE